MNLPLLRVESGPEGERTIMWDGQQQGTMLLPGSSADTAGCGGLAKGDHGRMWLTPCCREVQRTLTASLLCTCSGGRSKGA